LRDDTRAQSVGIAKFLLSLVVATILAWIVQRVANPILDGATGNTAKATQSIAWMQSIVDNLFLVFLVIAVFGLVALSVYQREVLG